MNKCTFDPLTIKNKMRELYKASFEDSEEYIEYFFNYKYAHNRIYTYFEKEELVSGLHIINKRLFFLGKEILLPYIVAAATDKKYRRMGHMRQLLLDAAKDLSPLIALYPFSHEYYEQFGYFSMNYVQKQKVIYAPTQNIEIIDYQVSEEMSQISSIYTDFVKDRDIYLLRNNKDFYDKLSEAKTTHGKCLIVHYDNNMAGYVLFDKEDIIETTLPYAVIANIPQLDGYTYSKPCSSQETTKDKNIMFMITDVKAFNNLILPHLIPHKELLNKTILITDNFITNNNNLSFVINNNANITYHTTPQKNIDYIYTTSQYGQKIFSLFDSFIMEKY